MPWNDVELNTGAKIPGIGFGTWKIPQETTASNLDAAFNSGYSHIDTAQIYGNEEQVGIAFKESGLARKDIWVTTKWSGRPWGNGDSISAPDSVRQSLEKLCLSSLDLYLVHTPRLFAGKPLREGWAEIVKLQKQGLTKAVGVSNFTLENMKELLEGEKPLEVVPACNQIELNLYNWHEMRPNVEYCQLHGIAIEAYSPLKSLTTYPGGPVDAPVNKIAERLGIKPEQVHLAWVKSKGAIALTTSRSKERLEAYIAAGDIELTDADIEALEKAGKKGPQGARRSLFRVVAGTLFQLAIFAGLQYGVDEIGRSFEK